MSRLVVQEILCPNCGAPIHASVYQTVNVTVDPSLKEAVLSRRINLTFCQRCKREVIVATDLLYHDMRKKFMVWLRMNEGQELGDGTIPELNMLKGAFDSYRLRLTNGWIDFIERIRILDAELNEGTVEILKFAFWIKVSGKADCRDNPQGLQFGGVEQAAGCPDALRFEYHAGPQPVKVLCPRSKYEDVEASFRNVGLLPPNGLWSPMDYKYVREKCEEIDRERSQRR